MIDKDELLGIAYKEIKRQDDRFNELMQAYETTVNAYHQQLKVNAEITSDATKLKNGTLIKINTGGIPLHKLEEEYGSIEEVIRCLRVD